MVSRTPRTIPQNTSGEADLARRLEELGRLVSSFAAIRASERLVVEEALTADPGSYDAVMPDCVLDSGLDRLKREAPVPAFGILDLSAGFLGALDRRFASVTRNRPIGDELRARLERYGHLPRFDRNVVLNLDFADITDDARWTEVLAGVGERFAGSSTTAVINGCSAVELRARPSGGAALVDPTGLALRLLGIAAEAGLGLRHEEVPSPAVLGETGDPAAARTAPGRPRR